MGDLEGAGGVPAIDSDAEGEVLHAHLTEKRELTMNGEAGG